MRSIKHDRPVTRIEIYRENRERLTRDIASRALAPLVEKPKPEEAQVIPFPQKEEPDDIVA